jgi:putative membrane-bound dehydrogenase-like protein
MDTLYKKIVYLSIAFFLLAACGEATKKFVDDQPRRVEILFLGHDQEHHNSNAYMPILASALAKDGINITYTEDVESLNEDNLNLYDGLILYANHDSIGKNEEKALLNYVTEGHAFIPIHCASYCFRNSPDFVNLVGGQFMEHDTATFKATIKDNEHPAMVGLEEFSTWDETYIHDKIADDITVLMERPEGDELEPWTWVKESGKGKVFYTAYGHDSRTWENPGFHKLIKNGILWTVSDQVRANWEEFEKDIPTLEYKEMANIPNYEKRTPAPKYQLPLSAEESAMLTQVPPGFKLELFASEPDIINPIAMNWDEKGRLWVIETVDYPNTVRDDKGVGDDKVKILEDTDGDGKADKVTVFADQLNIPTSFAFFDGGIVVSQAPHFLFLKDEDGDDKADVREILIDGWGTFDTHAGPSNLQYGIDNNLYGVLGYSGFKGKIFGKDQEFRQGIYSFNPATEEFDYLTRTSNNTWGLGMMEDNTIFASTANNTHSVFMGIPINLFDDVKGIKVKSSKKIDGHYDMKPTTRNYRQVDVFGGFTAAAGHHFYTARNYPESYWNKVAFVCEPTGGLVHIAKIEKDGAGYREKDGGNLVSSADEWFSPVEAKVGPDGVVWVADWYNFIVQHNPTPSEERGGYNAENGDGNAYVNPLRDKSNGRVWRIVPKDYSKPSISRIDKENKQEMVNALSNDNMFWRLTAQRLLVDAAPIDLKDDLVKMIASSKMDEDGLNAVAIHALWILQSTSNMERDESIRPVFIQALSNPSAGVRKAAIQALPKMKWSDQAIVDADLLHDEDLSVQLQALIYFADRSSSEDIGQVLFELSQTTTVKEDEWLSNAVYLAASKNASAFISAFLSANPDYKVNPNPNGEEEPESLDPEKIAETFVDNYINEVEDEIALGSDEGGKATVIEIGTIKNEMKYDKTSFTVVAGSPVEVVFENNDFMQHNILILKPGSKEKVGMAADKLAADPKGADRNYIPDLPEVLHSSRLVNPQEKAILKFTAPLEPGIYPYICTFPGHWRIMQGEMEVVAGEEL